jgi:ketosteroid isomerase-like protein
MKTFRLLSAILVAIVAGAATPAHDVRAQIAGGYRQYTAATIAKSVDGRVALYDPDATILPPRRAPMHGISAIRAYYASLRDPDVLDLHFVPLSVDVDGDYAIDVEAIAGDVLAARGKPPLHFRGKNLVVWHRQADGSWKILRDMWSSSQ